MTEVYTELLQENSELEAKIFRLEQENRELKAYKDVNEDFKKAWDELNKKYTEVLKLAKENADSNEYRLQELEKENKELKKQIESQKGLITVGGKQQYKYLQEIDKLQQENKELKEELKSYKHPDVVTLLTNWRTGELDRIHNKIANERDIYRSALEEIKEDFMCFRTCILPFHVGNKENLPHKMADAIQDYCESIKNKINEVLQ